MCHRPHCEGCAALPAAASALIGEATVAPPRREELASALERPGAEAALTAGAGLWRSGQQPDLAAAKGGAEETRWGSALQAGLQRAAPEIYRAICGEGSSSVWDWIVQRYQGSRTSPVRVDLWTFATTIDVTASILGAAGIDYEGQRFENYTDGDGNLPTNVTFYMSGFDLVS